MGQTQICEMLLERFGEEISSSKLLEAKEHITLQKLYVMWKKDPESVVRLAKWAKLEIPECRDDLQAMAAQLVWNQFGRS